jgi:DNA mismatch repair protein MutS2
MDRESLRRLDWPKIVARLAALTASAMGREVAEALAPATQAEEIANRLADTSEARELLEREPGLVAGVWHDVRTPVRRAQAGAVLEPRELFTVAQTLQGLRRLRQNLAARGAQYPRLAARAAGLMSLPELEREIFRAVGPDGEVLDGASRELPEIRRELHRATEHLRSRLEEFVRRPAVAHLLQEPIVTIRHERYVVPVKQEHRARIPGLIHDQSASGATVFIEPLEVVELNNEVRRLQAAEREEVQRILARFSGRIGRRAGEILASLALLGEIDFILAKGRLSLEMRAEPPELAREAVVDLRRARHPLLTGHVVPVDIGVGEDFDVLVITGPNTGGKTVALKTVGLLVLMAQAGLHIPADGRSRVGVFRQVFADIGDEQSIEQALSSFSSHITNLVGILAAAGSDSLVLLDELGAGTDPAQGAALGQAVLEELQRRGARTIATTHYAQLKEFAAAYHRVENASVEFDRETLRPTYRLVIGRPGQSSALTVAAGLGVPPEIVERARELLSPDERRLQTLLERAEAAARAAARDREEAARLRAEALELKKKYEELSEALEARRREILAEARNQAQALVREARYEATRIIEELRAAAARTAAREREAAVQSLRAQLRALEERLEEGTDAVAPAPAEELAPGDRVYIPRYRREGEVVKVAGSQVQVLVGAMKVDLPREELRRADPVTAEASGGHVRLVAGPRKVEAALNLRGLTVDEALYRLEKYLDEACLAGLPRVHIIHGKGTGAVRQAVHRYLTDHPRVKNFRLGEHGEGGLGVTVVELG